MKKLFYFLLTKRMGKFGKSRLRKGISIVASMVLLLNSIMPTVPVFAIESPLTADTELTLSDFGDSSKVTVNPGAYTLTVKDQTQSYEEYVIANTDELVLDTNWKIVDHRNFQGSNDPWLAQYYQINSPAEDGDGTGWDATHPVDPTKFPWLVINYNGFDGDKAIRVLYSGELNDFYWKPSAKVGDNEDRTYGIISVPDDEDLGMHEFVESREGTENFVDTSKMEVRIGIHQKKTDWESSLSTHTVKFQDSSESVNLTFEKVDGKIVLKKPGNAIKEEYVCNGWETGGYTFGEPITDDITLVANCTPAAVKYTAANGNVTYYDSIPSAFSSNGTYKLLKDVTRTTRMTPGTFASNVILDLNGYTLTSTASDYAILLSRNGSASSHKTFDIIDTSVEQGGKIIATGITSADSTDALISMGGNYNDLTIGEGVSLSGGVVALLGANQTLTVNGSINGGDDFAIATNGSGTVNPVINVNEGAEISSNQTAIYLPGKTDLTATIDGQVTGKTAVEIRAGTLTIGEGAVLTANGEFSASANGNGTTIDGAALAISQHTTNLPINVTVNGGTFNGDKAIYEEDLQDEVTEDVVLSIITGEFIGDVNSENITGFIDGGIFSVEPDVEYIVEGKVAVEDGAGKYVVQLSCGPEVDKIEYPLEACPEGGVCEESAGYEQDGNACTAVTGYKLSSCTSGYTLEGDACVINAGEDVEELVVPDPGTTASAGGIDDILLDNAEATTGFDANDYAGVTTPQIIIQQKTDNAALNEEGTTESALEDVLTSEFVVDTGKIADMQGILDLQLIYLDGSGNATPLGNVVFSDPVKVMIPVKAGASNVQVRVKHEGDASYGTNGLTLKAGANCNTDGTVQDDVDAYTGGDVQVVNGKAEIYTCSASSFVAYTETDKSSPTPSNKTSGGGGGGSSKKAVTTTGDADSITGDKVAQDDSKIDEASVGEDNGERVDEQKSLMTEDQAIAKFGQEQIDAYKWALENGITTMKTVEEARLDDPLTRAELAKMMVVYIQKVLEKSPVVTGDINYPDVKVEEIGDLVDYVKLAYQYQIMGINADGTPIELFNPHGIVSRGEYATVFSRVLFGAKFNKEGADFYTNHLEALKTAGILTNTLPTIQEMRGWVMLMMYRSSQNGEAMEKVVNSTEEIVDEAKAEEIVSEETVNVSDEEKSEGGIDTEETTKDSTEESVSDESSETPVNTAEATTGDALSE